MTSKFIRVLAQVDCFWEGLNPSYRLYVNDELFTERTWYWTEEFLEEHIQIEAPPGKYQLRWELVKPCLAELEVKHVRVDYGPGVIKENNILLIRDA